MGNNVDSSEENLHRRSYGAHLTSSDIFMDFIFPEIKENLWKYKWIDLYAGEGNLVLPILGAIPLEERSSFFKKHIYLSDIQEEMIGKCIKNAESYGIPSGVAPSNIKVRDNLEKFPTFLHEDNLPLFHITNPPYLYLGYINKHEETQRYLKFFKGENEGYQDLYQIAMINDLRNKIDNLIYIIPSNFLFGASVSNKFRLDFLKHYNIKKMIIFETKIFKYTGTNICIGFFFRKTEPKVEIVEFNGLKIKKKNQKIKRTYLLKPKYKYRAGSGFEEFLDEKRIENPLSVNYYLLKKEVMKNKGDIMIEVIDANNYRNNRYITLDLYVNEHLKNKIKNNILYVRTVDTGSYNGRVGLGIINEDFNVYGIYVSGNTYRTHPIQMFLDPELPISQQKLLMDYFNFILEYFRKILDSEFLTTYKYSQAEYTRKYLGLTQVRKLIQTFPYKRLNQNFNDKLRNSIESQDFEEIMELITKN
ncbi:MAG: N-6 DNA methylase [Candidatus Heimdallarchaeota archaeon]